MIYLGLGSNLGDRRQHLANAIQELSRNGFRIHQTSPIVESPALLKDDALSGWNRPYLNLVLAGDTLLAPTELLKLAKKIELEAGRDLSASRWSPREIDIDLLLWHDECLREPGLSIPHIEMHKRSFVMTPLMHIAPHLSIPGIHLTPMQISQRIRPIPLWMGIVNRTPDSFSDGGTCENLEQLGSRLDAWICAGVQILDVGGESTRPNAEKVDAAQEWTRLKPVFDLLGQLGSKHAIMPLISVDTRHAEVARRAFNYGADWVNDVTGLGDPSMLATVRDHQAVAVAMHSLSIPVVPGEALDENRAVEPQLLDWLDAKQRHWKEAGLEAGKIVFDPGVGFGKTALQNLDIVRNTSRLRDLGFRLMVGHSRKSFMNNFATQEFSGRDIETLGLSLAMCEQGVDIIRVHDPLSHIRAYRAWAEARAR